MRFILIWHFVSDVVCLCIHALLWSFHNIPWINFQDFWYVVYVNFMCNWEFSGFSYTFTDFHEFLSRACLFIGGLFGATNTPGSGLFGTPTTSTGFGAKTPSTGMLYHLDVFLRNVYMVEIFCDYLNVMLPRKCIK